MYRYKQGRCAALVGHADQDSAFANTVTSDLLALRSCPGSSQDLRLTFHGGVHNLNLMFMAFNPIVICPEYRP